MTQISPTRARRKGTTEEKVDFFKALEVYLCTAFTFLWSLFLWFCDWGECLLKQACRVKMAGVQSSLRLISSLLPENLRGSPLGRKVLNLRRGHGLVCREDEKSVGASWRWWGWSGPQEELPRFLQTGLRNHFSQACLVLSRSPAVKSAGRPGGRDTWGGDKCPFLPQFPHLDQNISRPPSSLACPWRGSRGPRMKKQVRTQRRVCLFHGVPLGESFHWLRLSFLRCQMRRVVTPTSLGCFEACVR